MALASPTIAILTGYENTFSVTERRDPTPFPGWPRTAVDLKVFPDKFESFVNDNFGLRSQLVMANNYARFLIGVSGSKNVLVGKDGWLFLGADNVVENYRGINEPKAKSIDLWFDTMNRRNDFLSRHGIRFLVVIVPDKHTIYPEYMPRHITRSGKPSALDTLLALAPSRAPNLEILDLKPVLLRYKAQYRLYHKTDSHWNGIGAFYGSQAIVGTLQAEFTALEIPRPQDFDIVERQTAGLGNARMLGIANMTSEHGLFLRNRGESRVLDRKTLDDRRPLSTQIITTDIREAPTIFILGDSFLQGPLDYLEQAFSKTVVVDRRGRGFDREFILEEDPDIVIFETVERNLFQQPGRE